MKQLRIFSAICLVCLFSISSFAQTQTPTVQEVFGESLYAKVTAFSDAKFDQKAIDAKAKQIRSDYETKLQSKMKAYKPQEYFGSQDQEIDNKRYPRCNELLIGLKEQFIDQLAQEKEFWLKNIGKIRSEADLNKKTFKPNEDDILLSAHREHLKTIISDLHQIDAPLSKRIEHVSLRPTHGFEKNNQVFIAQLRSVSGKVTRDTYSYRSIADIEKYTVAKAKEKDGWKFIWEDNLILSNLRDWNLFFKGDYVCWTELMDIVPVVNLNMLVVNDPAITDTLKIKMNEEVQDPIFAHQTIMELILTDENEAQHRFIYQGMDLLTGVEEGDYLATDARIYPLGSLLTIFKLSRINPNVRDITLKEPLKFYNIATNIGRFYVGDKGVFILGKSFANKY